MRNVRSYLQPVWRGLLPTRGSSHVQLQATEAINTNSSSGLYGGQNSVAPLSAEHTNVHREQHRYFSYCLPDFRLVFVFIFLRHLGRVSAQCPLLTGPYHIGSYPSCSDLVPHAFAGARNERKLIGSCCNQVCIPQTGKSNS